LNQRATDLENCSRALPPNSFCLSSQKTRDWWVDQAVVERSFHQVVDLLRIKVRPPLYCTWSIDSSHLSGVQAVELMPAEHLIAPT
jgi:hypothetical protein